MPNTKRTGSYSPTSEGTMTTRSHMTIPFNEISEPGVYYSHDTGWLYRVPEDMLALGHSPLINVVSIDENFVTKISGDPWLPVNKARQICANMDFAVNF
jgi:hypothetical protein